MVDGCNKRWYELMIKLKDILTEAKSMKGVTIGDKFINRSNKRELEVIDFYVTKNVANMGKYQISYLNSMRLIIIFYIVNV